MSLHLPVVPPSPAISAAHRQDLLARIGTLLTERRLSMADAIRERDLYFRVSVIGGCNLSCRFCHNEGAPTHGHLRLEVAEAAIAAAARVGFTRVQFTGGEPLLRTDIGDFVAAAKRHVDDVGVTTNGTFLVRALDSLVEAGIDRIHVSLQTESLIEAGSVDDWGIPPFLAPTIDRASAGDFSLRLNMPVPADCLPAAERFLHLLGRHRCDVKVFSVLPEGTTRDQPYPMDQLTAMVERVNGHRLSARIEGEVFLRGYRPPAGLRCPTCADRDRCREQSHSLRLGSDHTLRPCLATRAWDSPLRHDAMEASVFESAVLALDYDWSA